MPRGDGTGPNGMGSMTGRAAGYCVGYNVPGYANFAGRRGFYGYGRGWFGRGARRGWRNQYYATGLNRWARGYYGRDLEPTAEEEMQMLREQAEVLKQNLDDIQSRISTLENSTEK